MGTRRREDGKVIVNNFLTTRQEYKYLIKRLKTLTPPLYMYLK
jgi:hypothetical protein